MEGKELSSVKLQLQNTSLFSVKSHNVRLGAGNVHINDRHFREFKLLQMN
jgi:uncharacterized protein YunC (DUF1805 family)